MSQPPISPALRAWYKWKALRLPWRRQFLVGLDLQGNTYWEFLDRGTPLPPSTPTQHPSTNPPVRWRRIVRPATGGSSARATHPSFYPPVPPAWHSWLRHTRASPPSLAEQRAEVARQAEIKLLAARADARWAAKAKVMEDGKAGRKVLGEGAGVKAAPQPALDTEQRAGPGSRVLMEEEGAGEKGTALRDNEAVDRREETWRRMRQEAAEAKQHQKGPDPWKQARGGPSENWQPKAWEPAARGKK
ncbi:hypothetical protein C8A05DRAFT_15836 [Staphylotrichum tortipilum]|uniref:NADH dehydrogenase [ubiquinone] 1 alpha subcomplex subunit n=1 Tax=Staphylotrichum tortipilum TaxID=2831512 RepID=A0AAN6MJI4_9PEZI|nr:hypothetical protein C8A05DRAFT_15836 [Staphylotrichum longicolle]